ncbi:MAG: 16S rRNA (cytidine(1402)-2'-O)-methyltransferase [Hyphomicrobiales bacterium]
MQENTSSSDSGFFIDPASLRAKPLESALYIVATPIGNLGDITLRALQTLAGANMIACEDTRVTGKLLQRFSIKTRMVAYHDHNAAKQSPRMLSTLENGQSIALVSDAGTPLISDPGFRLINDVLEAGHKVIPLPGASSPIVALSAAGLPTDAFMFAGFLPPKKAARMARLTQLADIPATLVFLESPKRIAGVLTDCVDALGSERDAAVGRELTKLYETFSRGTVSELAAQFARDDTPKGEIVLMIGPPVEKTINQDVIDRDLRDLLKTHQIKEAASLLSKQLGLPKRDLYQRALALKEEADEGT